MYHGAEVPGFPQHPHRWFETITLVRKGLIDHSDSPAWRPDSDVATHMAHGRRRHRAQRDVPPRRHRRAQPDRAVQIWLNLPSAAKMVEPYFTMLWADDIPIVTFEGGSDTIVAGAIGDSKRPPLHPTPGRHATTPRSPCWVLRLDAGATWTMPPTHHVDVTRVVYFFEGDTLSIGGHQVGVLRPAQSYAAIPASRSAPATPPLSARCCRATDRRAGGSVRPIRDEHARRDRTGICRLPTHGFRRLALGRRRTGARRRPGAIRPPPRRAARAPE